MKQCIALIALAVVITMGTFHAQAATKTKKNDRKRDGSGDNCTLRADLSAFGEQALCGKGGGGSGGKGECGRKRDGSGSGKGGGDRKRDGNGEDCKAPLK